VSIVGWLEFFLMQFTEGR